MVQFDMATTIIKDVPYAISMMALTVGLCTYMLGKTYFFLVADRVRPGRNRLPAL